MGMGHTWVNMGHMLVESFMKSFFELGAQWV
jgi:hypothetical protein